VPVNQPSSNYTHARRGTDAQALKPDTSKLWERVKSVMRDPLTFVLLVWAAMFAIVVVYWLLSS